MFQAKRRKAALSGSVSMALVFALYACGKTDGVVDQPCERDSQCGDGECVTGLCTNQPQTSGGASGIGAPGSSCDSDGDCQSGACIDDRCAGMGPNAGRSGSGNGNAGTSTGSSGAGSGASSNVGSGGTQGVTPGSGSTTPGPHFTGSGKSFRPLTVGCGPETAASCTGSCEAQGGDPTTQVIRPPATLCFSGEGDPTPEDPSVVIEQVIESVDGKQYVHLRVTFDPAFTDNTFGAGSCCGWPKQRGHRFSDLTGSDHTELLLTNGSGETVMNFKVDLITQDPSAACGFGTLGVTGGDGAVLQGDAKHVLAVATSLDRNLNGCGYCEDAACGPSGDCTVDSPATDANYTPNPATPNWDYRQVYEVWVDLEAFASAGFGQAYITYTHSSPAKGKDTITVTPSPCPPEWDTPYCPPSVVQEGGNCFGGGGSGSGGASSGGGSGGGTSSGGNNGSGGSSGSCPPNYQIYLATEGAAICTPIPFSNYPGMTPCPTGYTLDLASEGQYCLPTR